MKTVKYFFISFCCCFVSFSAFSKIRVQLSESQIVTGDTVQFKIIIDDPKQAKQPPDLSALKDAFEILGRSQSQRISIINGQTEHELQWSYTLAPKETGTIKIPPIKVGNQWTEPTTLSVTKDPEELHKQQNVFLETATDINDPYVQSQVRYSVKLFYSENIMNGTLTDPEVENAVLMRISDDKNYQEQRAGRNYQVLERDYAIFPEKSGEIIIRGPSFSGLRTQVNQAFHQFDPFFTTSGIPVKLLGTKRILQVKPIPSNIPVGDWLPASSVTLDEKWQMPRKLEVGQPIVRIVTLKVEGATQAQLPELKQSTTPDINLYPEAAENENSSEHNAIIATRRQKFTYIPTQAGEIHLPAINISWWHTSSNTPKLASLPEKVISVNAIANAPIESLSPTTDAAPQATQPELNTQTILGTQHKNSSTYFYLSIVLFLLWLSTVLMWWIKAERLKTPTQSLRALTKAVILAANRHDPISTERAIIAWASALWPEAVIRNLQDVAHLAQDLSFESMLKELEAARYQQNQTWRGGDIAGFIKKFKAHQKASNVEESLPSLY